jgi:hypothetical protein
LQITVPEFEIAAHKEFILKNHKVFSKNDVDIGVGNNFQNRIPMKNKDPVYIPLFRIADTYREVLHAKVKFIVFTIFVVPKKNGSVWVRLGLQSPKCELSG